MIRIIINKLLKKCNDQFIKIYIFFLKRKIRLHVLSNRINSINFFKIVLSYLNITDKNQYVAIGHLKNKIKVDQSKKTLNPIEYLLPVQQKVLPIFFINNLACFNIDKCLGIGDDDNQVVYEETINHLIKQSNELDSDHFISLISKKKPFHYLKYTHGFWDTLVRCAVKEYALKNGKEIIMSKQAVLEYNVFANNNFAESTFKLVNSEKFINMVSSKDIYFCPTLANGSISSKIELKIMNELSKKNILHNYSQLMILDEFSKNKEITPSNIFKKIICTKLLRNIFLNKINQYDLILICNHRAASKLSKMYPKFKKIYSLPDIWQDMKHYDNPMDFANDICESVLTYGSTKPILILSQAAVLSTFISFIILTKYKEENISLIDIGKPLQTLFNPEITAGGVWRYKNNLKNYFFSMSHFISEYLFTELKKDTEIDKIKNFRYNQDMDIEDVSLYKDTLF